MASRRSRSARRLNERGARLTHFVDSGMLGIGLFAELLGERRIKCQIYVCIRMIAGSDY